MNPAANNYVAVIGLGYVGLPVALALSRVLPQVIGYDTRTERINQLEAGYDSTNELSAEDLASGNINYTFDANELRNANFYIITVPTPIDDHRRPDLGPLAAACETIGRALNSGSVVVLESTVYPGVTEEFCGPILERYSGLKAGVDFALGYSPERINPGDREHRLQTIVKVIAASDPKTLERLRSVYGAVVTAGLHVAPTIKVAEAAKVIENTQRDLNIALMNELALIFDRLGIRTKDVLEAAGSKWNFLKFTPGLVGGHCIGVDPYYLTARAELSGYFPEVILAGRRINDNISTFIAQKTVKLLIEANIAVRSARVGVLGITFKENVPDVRNSKVPDIVRELAEFGVGAIVHDAMASSEDVREEYRIELADLNAFHELDALIIAVAHQFYCDLGQDVLLSMLTECGVFVDVKSVFDPARVNGCRRYWSL